MSDTATEQTSPVGYPVQYIAGADDPYVKKGTVLAAIVQAVHEDGNLNLLVLYPGHGTVERQHISVEGTTFDEQNGHQDGPKVGTPSTYRHIGGA